MLYPVEHCAMTALAFRQDAEIRALPKMSPKQLTEVKKTLEARAFERGDHQPDGTIFWADHAVRQADPYDTRDYLMPPQDLLKNKVAGKVVGRGTPLTVAVDIGGHCHSVSHPSQPLTNPKTALEWLNAEESRHLLEVERVRHAQQLNDERTVLKRMRDEELHAREREHFVKLESTRKATIRAAFEAARLDELHTPRQISGPIKHMLANPPAASWPSEAAEVARRQLEQDTIHKFQQEYLIQDPRQPGRATAASWPTLYEMELQQRPLRMAVERGMIPAGGLKASDLFKAGMV